MKFEKIIIPFLFLCFMILVYIERKVDYNSPLQQRLDGYVRSIDWKSWNHGIPQIEIRRENGTKIIFSNSKIILTPNSLKVGDYIFKENGSKICEINTKKINCLK